MLDKKLCRRHADPGLELDPDNGLLHAKKVEYIVRTEVKDIEADPVLVLHFYPRERAAQGDCTPLWTMFQGRDDYVTLERGEDGKTRWRTAAFRNLGREYRFEDYCAFYSAQDERRVASYFKDDKHTGFLPLTLAQNGLMEARGRERQLARERKIVARMEGLPPLPDGLEDWAHREILPGYFFYGHARKGVAAGRCSVCGSEITLTDVKHNGEATCPHCGRELTMKPRGRVKRLYDRETCQVVQRTAPGELVVRILKATAAYEGNGPIVYVNVREVARQFVRVGPDGQMVQERFYLAYHGELTDWKDGDRPSNMGHTTFEGETCGHLYCDNLPDALAGTPWQYCPVRLFYEHRRNPMEMVTFLYRYLEHPRLEHLVKTGFYSLAADMVYNYYVYKDRLDETQNRTHRILGVMAGDVPFLRELDINSEGLKVYQEYCRMNLKDRQKLLLWQAKHGVKWNVVPILEHMTAHKFMRYVDGQYPRLRDRKAKYGGHRYGSMQAVVTEYKDYLEMCQKQKYDLANSFVLYPADLQKAHDKVAQRIKHNADAKLRRDFRAAYKRVMGRLDFEAGGMKIVYPASSDEIVAEGHALHHCVGGYVDQVAKQKCMILFLRRCADEGKPFYTVEVQGREVVQVRGMENKEATPEVRKFMDLWEKRVLRGLDAEDGMEVAA